MKIKPLSPNDIKKDLGNLIPRSVIKAVNNLLKKEFRGSPITLTQTKILAEIFRIDKRLNHVVIVENNWLDFEPVFEEAGWKVYYDKPGYCEDYEPTFRFTPKR